MMVLGLALRETLGDTGVSQPSPLKGISSRDSGQSPPRVKQRVRLIGSGWLLLLLEQTALRMSFSLQLQKEVLLKFVSWLLHPDLRLYLWNLDSKGRRRGCTWIRTNFLRQITRKVGTQKFFSLPSSLFLWVITPLDLIHLDRFSPSWSFFAIQNLGRVPLVW